MLGIEFTWYRQFADGHIEYEFDPVTGAETKWGAETPRGITETGWLPMTSDLAKILAVVGIDGIPTQAPMMSIQPGEEEVPVLFRDRELRRGAYVTCKICGESFLSTQPPEKCLLCEAEPEEGKSSPFKIDQAEWEQAVYEIGIKGKFLQRFTPHASLVK